MGYLYMSNINNFGNVTNPNTSYQTIGKFNNSIEEGSPGVITFYNEGINEKANFIMIRAHDDNDLLVQLYPSQYGIYIPAGELWSADLLDPAEKIIVRNIFSASTHASINTGKIQWIIGYK